MAKGKTLAPIRVDDTLDLRIKQRANALFPDLSGQNVSKYIRFLIEDDINQNKSLQEKEEECIRAETMFLQHQIVRIGNNLNQIAHGINIIKKSKNISYENIVKLDLYYEELRKISFNISKLS